MSFYVHPEPQARTLSATVYLARHGAHDEVGRVLSGRSEIALNAAGRDQAGRLAARLQDVALDGIFTSPRRRARETAAAVSARCGLEAAPSPALDEIDFGEWAGNTFESLEGDPRWRRWNEARGRAETPAGETMDDVTRRAAGHLEACKGTVLCVSHCDVIRGLIAHYTGWDADRLLSFEIDVASLTTIHFAGGAGRVVAVNERVA